MSERTELVMLAGLLYNAFKDRPSLAWMGPFEQMSLVRKENWLRVAWAVKTNRWRAFSDDELNEIKECAGYGTDTTINYVEEIESELTRLAAAKQERGT